MNKIILDNLNHHLNTFNSFETEHVEIIKKIYLEIQKSLSKKGRVYLVGNGGSAADCQHFAAEMMIKFEKNRKAIPFISLTNDTSILTACSNDFSFDKIFSRQLEALIKKNDLLIAFTTSGKSKNIINALKFTKRKKIKSIVFTGLIKNNISNYSSLVFKAPSKTVSRIQEMHIFCIHLICNLIDYNA